MLILTSVLIVHADNNLSKDEKILDLGVRNLGAKIIDVLLEELDEGSGTGEDIVLKIADETNIKQIDVKKVVQKTFDAIIDSLVRW
jgi:hypothetical protein